MAREYSFKQQASHCKAREMARENFDSGLMNKAAFIHCSLDASGWVKGQISLSETLGDS